MSLIPRILTRATNNQALKTSFAWFSDEAGSGSGKGGGSGGSIRNAGGAFGKREAAQENQYFRKQEQEQLARLKKTVDGQINTHQQLIKQHEEAIAKAKKELEELEKGSK